MKSTTLINLIGMVFAAGLAIAIPTAQDSPPMIPSDMSPNPSTANTALGINCRGSIMCNKAACPVYLNDIKYWMDQVSDTAWFPEGKHIVCEQCDIASHRGICAFFQKMGGDWGSGALAKEKLADLMKHGCKQCGSCPTKPWNDVNTGELTINYVMKGCGRGLCG